MTKSSRRSAGAREASPPPALSGEQIDALTAAVEKLTDTVHVLGQILDDLRDDFAWALQNSEPLPRVPGNPPLTSMPKDPLAKNFGERLNRFTTDDLPDELKAPGQGVPMGAPRQADLF